MQGSYGHVPRRYDCSPTNTRPITKLGPSFPVKSIVPKISFWSLFERYHKYFLSTSVPSGKFMYRTFLAASFCNVRRRTRASEFLAIRKSFLRFHENKVKSGSEGKNLTSFQHFGTVSFQYF